MNASRAGLGRRPRTAGQLLLDRNFGTLFWGKVGSLAATWAFTVISVTVAYDVTRSAQWAGLVSAAQMAPQLAFTLVSGRLADTYGEKRIIVVGAVIAGAATALLGLYLLVEDPQGVAAVIPVLVSAFVAGSGLALFAPAMQSMVGRLVRADELSSAVSLNFLPTALARTVGPAGGAALLVGAGPAVSFLVLGAMLAGTAGCFLGIRQPLAAVSDADRSVWSAVSYVVRDRVILAYLVAVGVIGAGAEPAITLAPAIADSVGRHEAAGWLLAAFGSGGLLGVVVHRYARRRLGLRGEGSWAMVVMALTMMLAVAGSDTAQIAIALSVAGCAMVVGLTSFSVGIQQRCAPAMLGRVMAMWVLAFSGTRPLSAVALGALTERHSVELAVISSGAFVLVAVTVLTASARTPRAALSTVIDKINPPI